MESMQIGQNQTSRSPVENKGRQRPQKAEKKQGALIIIDSFHSSTEHGKMVEATALAMGPTGAIHRYNHLQEQEGKATSPIHSAFLKMAEPMTGSLLPAAEAKKQFEQFLNDSVSGLLDHTTSILQQVTRDGFEDSVANLSQGMSVIEYLVASKQPLGDKSLGEREKLNYINNLYSAVVPQGVDQPGPAEFDNLLLQKIKSVLKESPRIQESKNRWREQVQEFESGNNSLVIAAGNAGEIMSTLLKGSFDTDGSEDENVLSTPEATMVAATATTEDGRIFLAGPSSYGPEVDFIASGFHGEHFGSSFAGPKVAVAMLALHVSNPGSDSESIEKATGDVLGQKVEIRDHEVIILNEPLTSKALQQIADDAAAS